MNFETIIIDDDEVILILFKKMMTATDFHDSPLLFSNGGKGVNHLRSKLDQKKSSVLFLDINMPEISGWEILDEIEIMSKTINIHVILISSSSNQTDKVKAAKYKSIIKFLEKPLLKKDFEELKNHPKLVYLFGE